MRRRTALPATATTALLAAALLLPATTAAADTAPSPAPGTSVPAADPAPQLTSVDALQTDHGYVLRATASGDVDHVTFVLQQNYPTGDWGPKIDITVSQPAADGSWQTTGPLHLPHGYYAISAIAYAADGTPSLEGALGGDPVPITLLPVFHDTVFGQAPLSYDNQVETVTGYLTTYDPDSGDTGTPWTGPLTIQASAGNTNTPTTPNRATTQTIATDGSWSIAFQPNPNTGSTMAVSVAALLPFVVCPECSPESIPGPSTTVAAAVNTPTRIVLDHTGATLTAGTKTTVSGTLEYQNTSGWHPVPGGFVFLGGDGTWSSTQAETDTNGRFSFTMTVPDTSTSWPIYTSATSVSLYLAAAQASETVTSMPDQPVLQLSGASIDANSNLTIHQSVTSTTGIPGGNVQLQQSSDGRTGWATITTLPATTATHTVHVSNPHGYWRLYTPTAPGYAQAVSGTVHTFRYQTRITGGPTTTNVRPGTWVHFTGTLAQQGYGPWTAYANQTVQLWFRPAGSTRSYLAGTAHTNTAGAFALWARPTTSGTWTLSYQTTSVWNTNASTTATIHVS
ncbi:hypothetical protein [Streptacidiphilus fuscans]|uniref:Uncharacterized protein n=1 Tax=Streptacidiphilus fuscans TaxID=2789292 RepID=A0A931BEN9_9ACTN|nr:hypothetical protein [Streptacidiphilus fuscans]MBF9073902.1 hypothetical protein [Streptacidiphilus fuscans]